jgi:hypothetical protein
MRSSSIILTDKKFWVNSLLDLANTAGGKSAYNRVPDADLTEIRSPLIMATNPKNVTTKLSGPKGVPPAAKKAQVARPNKVTRTEYVFVIICTIGRVINLCFSVDAVNRAAEGFLQIYYECMDGPLRDAASWLLLNNRFWIKL